MVHPEIRRVNLESREIAALRASWRRSEAAGLGEDIVRPTVLTKSAFEIARDRSARLLKYGQGSMENTHEQLAGTHSAVMLADSDGVILCCKGDIDFTTGPHGRAFVAGVC